MSSSSVVNQELPSDIYHSIFEHSPMLLAIIEEDGTICLANTQFSEEVGYPREEIEGKMTWGMFAIPEQPETSGKGHREGNVQKDAALLLSACKLKRRDGTVAHSVFRTGAIPKTNKTICSGINVAVLKQGGAELEENERHFRAAFEASPIGVAIVSLDGRWLRVNPALCNSLGYSENELLAKTFHDITHPDDVQNDLEHLKRLVDDQISYYQIEKRFVHRDGYTVWAILHVSIVRDSRGYPLYLIGQMEDITERKWLEDRMQTALMTDELTGLYNRRGFVECGVEQLKRASNQAKPAILFLVTLDGMKEVNQALGQKQGDAMLREIGHMLREASKGKGTVGRTGGVEFSVLIVDATEVEATQIDHCIARFEQAHRGAPSLRISVHAKRCSMRDDLLRDLELS